MDKQRQNSINPENPFGGLEDPLQMQHFSGKGRGSNKDEGQVYIPEPEYVPDERTVSDSQKRANEGRSNSAHSRFVAPVSALLVVSALIGVLGFTNNAIDKNSINQSDKQTSRSMDSLEFDKVAKRYFDSTLRPYIDSLVSELGVNNVASARARAILTKAAAIELTPAVKTVGQDNTQQNALEAVGKNFERLKDAKKLTTNPELHDGWYLQESDVKSIEYDLDKRQKELKGY